MKIQMTFEEMSEALAQAVMEKNCGSGAWHCRPVFHFDINSKNIITGVTIDIQPGNV